ncbi:OmpH family outer membrane protein [Allosphingosinicella flava]|uniref:OmpH family outer membrane protein n=1 Tax=Allosphingosinicella flava TaxID=2771430 RepID=A0A7T2LMW4_9SPHN|nr:OmpH family outer membrane protein [Sphingosinicella flava]QPQ55718.1 OmpH family outer membrane protein [Sphingosinicella flava]
MKKLLLGAAAVAALLPAAAPAQRLNPAVIAVVDTQRILAECTACVAANTQLQTQLNQLRQRANTLSQPLQTEAQAIQTAVNALNGKQPDAALQARITALQTRETTANREIQQGEQNLRSTQAHVQQQLGTRLGPIINSVMTTRGAVLVVDKGATLASSPSLDVTNDVLAQLNQQLPSVSVTPLPQQPAPAQPTGR